MHECALEFTEYALILLYVIEFTFLAPLNFATRLAARPAYYRKTARKTWILFYRIQIIYVISMHIAGE